MRLAVVLSSLGGGGIEKIRINLAREWIRQGVEVDLVVGRRSGVLSNTIPKGVNVFEIARWHPTLFLFGLRRYFEHRKPSHVLSAGNDINALTLWGFRKVSGYIPIVISVHANISAELENARGISRLKTQAAIHITRKLMRHCHSIIAVSQGVAVDLAKYVPVKQNHLHIIYNPAITTESGELSHKPLHNLPVPAGRPWIAYVGRFTTQKGLDVLIAAFKHVSERSNAELVLIGEGPTKADIISTAQSLGLGSRVHVLGFQANPLPWMREANVVVLPSRFEGFGNVLVEALACGTQVVATDCPSGPAEILDAGRYGQLVAVGDSVGLAEALLRSLHGGFRVAPDLLRKRAEQFSVQRVARRYLDVLTERCNGCE